MPKIKDRCIVKWIDNNKKVEEELVFYASGSESESESEKEPEPLIVEEVVKDESASESVLFLDPIQQMCIICFNACIEKFVILRCISQKDNAPLDFNFPEYKTIEDRYGDKLKYGEELYSEKRKRFKDLTLAYSIFYRTAEDLSKKGTISSLDEGTNILKKLFDDETIFLNNVANSISLENNVNRRLLTEAEELDKQYKDKLDELRKLEIEYEDAIAYGKLELKYVEAWEASRRHQAKVVIERTEEEFQKTIDNFTLKIKQENLIHSDIITYLGESIEDMQNEIQEWMERYEDEIEDRDADLLRTKMNRENQKEKSAQLKYIYEERKEFIDSWQEILEKRRQAEEELRIKTEAAVKLQSWWRGLMVRKKLGRFRPKKGKKKGKGKGKGAKITKKKK